jgi:hypothetical protein
MLAVDKRQAAMLHWGVCNNSLGMCHMKLDKALIYRHRLLSYTCQHPTTAGKKGHVINWAP